jgi:SAM-dependent methyltransferase
MINILKRVYRKVKKTLNTESDTGKLPVVSGNAEDKLLEARRILSEGERFDPQLSANLWPDNNHVPRYKFANEYVGTEDTVLDIACGTGYGTEMLSMNCKFVTGVDISQVAIDYAKSKRRGKNIQFLLNDFFSTEVIADVTVSFETIEHIITPDFNGILSKLISLSRRRIIGSVPYLEKPGNNPHHHSFNLTETSFELLNQLGSTIFFYQTGDGVIHSKKPEGVYIQNMIFVFTKI